MSWRSRLAELMADTKPVNYTYGDVAGLLRRLGFELQPSGGGTSHRKWRLTRDGRPSVWIGLVEKGHGPLPRGYVREVQRVLRDAGLWSEEPRGDEGEANALDD